MKKKLKIITKIISIIFITINIFINSKIISKNILFSINMFVNNIFPSLFPMFIISDLLISIQIPTYLGYLFQNISKKIFKTSGYVSFIFFMSLLTGFPSNAKYINSLYDENKINKEDAKKALLFTFFPNPLFIINTIGIIYYNNDKISILIILSLVISNISIGILFRSKNNSNNIMIEKPNIINDINKQNIFKTIIKSIKNSIEVLLNIFGIITFCIITLTIIKKTFKLNVLESILVTGLFEMSTGIKLISISKLNTYLKYIITIIFLSFGGLSIHAQIFSILKIKTNYLKFLLTRIIGCIISILAFIILTQLFKY